MARKRYNSKLLDRFMSQDAGNPIDCRDEIQVLRATLAYQLEMLDVLRASGEPNHTHVGLLLQSIQETTQNVITAGRKMADIYRSFPSLFDKVIFNAMISEIVSVLKPILGEGDALSAVYDRLIELQAQKEKGDDVQALVDRQIAGMTLLGEGVTDAEVVGGEDHDEL